MTAEDLMRLLHEKYADEQRFLLMEEVATKTGGGGMWGCPDRRADAILASFWGKDKYRIDGFEIKVSRQDWLREMADRSKAGAFTPYCDRWWIVAPSTKIVHHGELGDWGLMVATRKGNKLRVAVDAKINENVQDLPRPRLLAMLRAATKAAVKQAEIAALQKVQEYEAYRIQALQADNLLYELQDLRKRVKLFEEASGVQIGSSFSAPRRGKDYRAFLRFLEHAGEIHRLLETRQRWEAAFELLQEAHDELSQLFREEGETDAK